MFNKLRNKFKRYSSIFKETKNWPSYLAFKLGIHHGNNFIFHFRDGLSYSVPINMIGPFRECFFDDQYLQKIDIAGFPPKPTIIDIGGNVGYAALYFFKRFPDAIIHSFEPMPYMQNMLLKHKQEFKQYQWEIHPYGLWKEEGDLEIFTTSKEGFTSVSGVMKFPDSDTTINIKVKKLDDFIKKNNIEFIDMLKVDCEGAEYEILFSMSDETLNKVKRIGMETHVTENNKTEDLVDFLRQKGYTVQFVAKQKTGLIWAWK